MSPALLLLMQWNIITSFTNVLNLALNISSRKKQRLLMSGINWFNRKKKLFTKDNLSDHSCSFIKANLYPEFLLASFPFNNSYQYQKSSLHSSTYTTLKIAIQHLWNCIILFRIWKSDSHENSSQVSLCTGCVSGHESLQTRWGEMILWYMPRADSRESRCN